MKSAGLIDENALAADYAKRCGWPNKEGFQVAHPDDIAKAMLAFLREVEAAKQASLPQDAIERMRVAMHQVDCPHKDALSVRDIEMLAEAALAALPPVQEVSEEELSKAFRAHVVDGYSGLALTVNRAIEAMKEAGYRIVKGGAHVQ